MGTNILQYKHFSLGYSICHLRSIKVSKMRNHFYQIALVFARIHQKPCSYIKLILILIIHTIHISNLTRTSFFEQFHSSLIFFSFSVFMCLVRSSRALQLQKNNPRRHSFIYLIGFCYLAI